MLAKALALGLVVGLAAGSAQSAPYTLYFDYTITRYIETNSGAVPGNVGSSYSGWLTFDPDNGIGIDQVTDALRDRTQYVEWGCSLARNGACAADQGTARPVVTAYSIITPVGAFGRWTDTALAPQDYSERRNLEALSVKPNADYWIATSRQRQDEDTGTLTSPGLDYVRRSGERYLHLAPFTTPSEAPDPFTAYDQLAEAPTVLPVGQWNLRFIDQSRADRYTDAGSTFLGYRPGSFEMQGTLTSARLVDGEAHVPLPGTVALLGLGALGLVGVTRLQPRA
jgi:hypothetical protein